MTRIVPRTWMPAAQMDRIHVHWTAGGHKANSTDKKSYHVLVEGSGKLVRGSKSIAANERNSGMRQASHTLRANTGAIGVSLCCMAGARERPFDPGRYPMTEVQWDNAIRAIAELADRYEILVTPTTILTHAEVQPNLHIRQRAKWDITRLAFRDDVAGASAVGDLMRRQVAELLDKGQEDTLSELPEDMRLPKFRVAGVDPSSLNFRDAPGGRKKGALPERSKVERLAVIGEWWQVRTRAGYVGWVHSAFLRPA